MPSVTLADRAHIAVSGRDAPEFLQSLITTDLPSLPADAVRPGALLTPQGKILFDFLISGDGDGFLIETSADQRDAFVKRLTMYKLRAAVEISPRDETATTVSWDLPEAEGKRDARFAKAGVTVLRSPGAAGSDDAALYDALRVENGIVESGRDFALSDAFPHDVLLDLTDGLSFRKGCYVGQEVVSRMQHRGTARRRPVIVRGEADLPPAGTDILAGGKPVGTLGTVAGKAGLAIVRIDRAADAQREGTPLLAGDVPVTVSLPGWSGLAFPQEASEAGAQ